MKAVAENGNTVVVRRSTLEWVLFGALGFFATAVAIWVGIMILDLDKRVTALESQQSATHEMCQAVQQMVGTVNARLINIERILMERGGGSLGDGGIGQTSLQWAPQVMDEIPKMVEVEPCQL